MRLISATQKGLITGAVMILISLAIYYGKGNFDNQLQYITYTAYVAGILWTMITFTRQNPAVLKFGTFFSQGFKCFIVVTLLMVLFTFIFLQTHPEFKDQMAAIYKEQLVKQGNTTPNEIEERIKLAKKSFTPAMLMATIFSYLVIGAMVTAVSAGVIIQRKKQQAFQTKQ
jgi:hypothetical protein